MFKTVPIVVYLLIVATVSATTVSQGGHIQRLREKCENQKPLICVLSPANESNISGTILFRPVFRLRKKVPRCYVRINAMVSGLTGRRHGFHIHEYGDISDATGSSTGGHFLNPEGTFVEHGLPNDEIRHWGDFGNLRAQDGVATYSRLDRVISLPGILGRGITVHALRDQGAAEQPTGASGPRIGFCVIGFANPASVQAFFG